MSAQQSTVSVKERRQVVYQPAPEAQPQPLAGYADYQPCSRSTTALLEAVPAGTQPQGLGIVAADLLGESSRLALWVIWVNIAQLRAYLAQRVSYTGLPLRVLHHEDAVDLLAFARLPCVRPAQVEP